MDSNTNTPKFLVLNEVEEIQIIADGNCFYHSLSQALDKSQENYKYYRKLIFNFIEQNKELLKRFFIRNDNEMDEHYQSRYNSFISSIRNNCTFADDFEISTASIILNLKIVIYYNTILGYKYLNEYKPNDNIKNSVFLVYRNNIHFNLMRIKNSNPEESGDISIKEINSIHKNIENRLDKINLSNFFIYLI